MYYGYVFILRICLQFGFLTLNDGRRGKAEVENETHSGKQKHRRIVPYFRIAYIKFAITELFKLRTSYVTKDLHNNDLHNNI